MQNEIQTQDIVTVMVKGLDTVRSLYQDTFRYECAEIGGATKFTLYWDNVEIGQRIIYPGGFGGSPSVSDVFTAKDRTGGGIFENICKRLDDALDERLTEARTGDGQHMPESVVMLAGDEGKRIQRIKDIVKANPEITDSQLADKLVLELEYTQSLRRKAGIYVRQPRKKKR